MSRKTSILTLAIGGVCCFGVSKASAQFLANNVWPNPDLSVAAPTGVDQVYSYYNGTHPSGGPYVPSATGDTNPRPDGWHRGGNHDFGITTAPSFTFYNTPGNSAGEGAAPAGLNGYALEVSDSDVNFYGEWFSDWNPLGAVATAGGGVLQFWYEDTAPQPRDGQLRVTINFGDAVNIGDITAGDPNNLGHIDTTFNNPSADVGTWTEVDVPLGVLPAGTESARITIDSGGGSDTTGDIWVGDISVAVPEPASIGMITAGSMMLLARRRRAKAAL